MIRKRVVKKYFGHHVVRKGDAEKFWYAWLRKEVMQEVL
jgi:hypothetical protein